MRDRWTGVCGDLAVEAAEELAVLRVEDLEPARGSVRSTRLHGQDLAGRRDRRDHVAGRKMRPERDPPGPRVESHYRSGMAAGNGRAPASCVKLAAGNGRRGDAAPARGG